MGRNWMATGVLLLLVGCSSHREAANPHLDADTWGEQRSVIVQSEPMPVAKQMAGKSGVIRLAMTDAGFTQTVVRAPLGSTVKLYLRNDGQRIHNFVVPRFHIATSDMLPGAENYVEFTVNERGDWPFFSDATGSEEAGLSGILKVE